MIPQTSIDIIKDFPFAFAMLDKNLCFTGYSKIWLQEFEIDHDNLLHQPYEKILPNFPLKFKEIFEELNDGKNHYNETIKFIHSTTGTVQWFKFKIGAEINEYGTISGLHIYAENITDSSRKMKLLKKINSVARIGGWEHDLVTDKLYWTDFNREILEVPEDYVVGSDKGIPFYKKGFFRDEILRLCKKIITDGTPFDVEVQLVTAKGKTLWVRNKGEGEFINGRCTRIFGTVHDINDQKLAEIEYNTAAERLALATNASGIGIWEIKLPELIAVWNDMCYKVHQIDKTEYPNPAKKWMSMVHPDDFASVLEQTYINNEGKVSNVIEYRIILPDNSIRYIKSIVTFITNKDVNGQSAIGISLDVTKEKRAEQNLQKSVTTIRAQNENLMNFANVVSHDLRAHSTNLSLVTDFLINEQDIDEKLKLIGMLKEATDSLSDTVHNLNDVVQSTAVLTEKMVSINLKEAVLKAKNNVAISIEEKNVVLNIDISNEDTIMAIPAYLDSILLNLIINSIKYYSPERDLIIDIKTKKADNNLILTFKDNGKGIDLKKHGKNIFGMYKTFHRNKDAKGVGLYITKNQIEAMGGKISVKSKVDSGTSFILEFKTN